MQSSFCLLDFDAMSFHDMFTSCNKSLRYSQLITIARELLNFHNYSTSAPDMFLIYYTYNIIYYIYI